MAVNALFMLMPKAAMNKNDFAHAWENQVRFTRKITAVEAETESKTVNKRTNQQFWSCVAAANSPHVFGTPQN